jgi:hemophore-related protein
MNAKPVIVAAAAAMALCASGAVASAAPDVEAIVNTPCNYGQVQRALNAQDPAVAGQLASSPFASGWLQNLLASGPDGRRTMLAQVQGIDEVQQYSGVINQVVYTCQNF